MTAFGGRYAPKSIILSLVKIERPMTALLPEEISYSCVVSQRIFFMNLANFVCQITLSETFHYFHSQSLLFPSLPKNQQPHLTHLGSHHNRPLQLFVAYITNRGQDEKVNAMANFNVLWTASLLDDICSQYDSCLHQHSNDTYYLPTFLRFYDSIP